MTKNRINHKRHIGTILFIFLTLGLLQSAEAGQKYNVLFIAIDDLRPELACYGNTHIKSPNIDRLASEGILFERAYCSVPTCGPSRASLMTSVYPASDRFVSYNDGVDKHAPAAVTLPETFKKAGYLTVSNGKVFHEATDTEERSRTGKAWRASGPGREGLDRSRTIPPDRKREKSFMFECLDVEDNAYEDGMIAEKTIDSLRELKKSGKPFFLACGFHKPHMPFFAPKKYWDLYNEEEIEIATNRARPENAPKDLIRSGEPYTYYTEGVSLQSDEGHRKMRHGYYACVSYSDKLTGDVLNELTKLGLDKSTIVILWGDHGWNLGEHNFWGKHNTMHPPLRVPLIVKVPDKLKGEKVKTFVESVDIFPTLCELTGLEIPKTVQGRSFAGLLDAPEKQHRDHVYCRFKQGDTVLNDHYSYTLYKSGADMLYDHIKDPEENVNISGETEYKDVVQTMKKLLEKHIALAESAKVK